MDIPLYTQFAKCLSVQMIQKQSLVEIMIETNSEYYYPFVVSLDVVHILSSTQAIPDVSDATHLHISYILTQHTSR